MPALERYDQPTLLTAVAKGEEAAFRQLFEQHWGNIYGVAMAFTKSAVIAEEMVQDIFMKIWQQRESLPQISQFNDYLFIIARNHIISTLRKKIHEQPFTDHLAQYFSDTAADPEHQLLYRETESLLHKAVEQLPPQQQLIFRLSREQGLSQEEIAEKLGISKNTIKSHMNKALHSIRHYLQTHTQAEAFVLLYCIVSGLR